MKLRIMILLFLISLVAILPGVVFSEQASDPRCIEGNCISGRGKWALSDRYFYEGEWAQGYPNGRGKMVSPRFHGHNTIYEGDWKNGRAHGKGILSIQANGMNSLTYEGDFLDGRPSGLGSMYGGSQDESYTGDWKNGLANGQGSWIKKSFSSVEKYSGTFSNGSANGSGVYTDSFNRKYDGQWKNGSISGPGVYTDATGDIWDITNVQGVIKINGRAESCSTIQVADLRYRITCHALKPLQ